MQDGGENDRYADLLQDPKETRCNLAAAMIRSSGHVLGGRSCAGWAVMCWVGGHVLSGRSIARAAAWGLPQLAAWLFYIS